MAKLTLTQTARFLKSEWLLLILGTVSIALFIVAILSFSRGRQEPPPQGAPWQGNIYAGRATLQELESKLGPPPQTSEKDGELVYLYSSTSQYRSHQIEFSGNIISIIKEQVIAGEKGELADYLQEYGQPEAKFFGPHGSFAPGHFWGKDGLLVFAGQFDGTIVEIWYFAPTTLGDFLQQHPEFSLEEPQNF